MIEEEGRTNWNQCACEKEGDYFLSPQSCPPSFIFHDLGGQRRVYLRTSQIPCEATQKIQKICLG